MFQDNILLYLHVHTFPSLIYNQTTIVLFIPIKMEIPTQKGPNLFISMVAKLVNRIQYTCNASDVYGNWYI